MTEHQPYGLFEEYAALKLQEKQIGAKLKSLSQSLQPFLTDELTYTDKGSFQLKTRTSYAHSMEVEQLEKQVAKLKKEEINQGLAKVKTCTPYISYTAPKEELNDDETN